MNFPSKEIVEKVRKQFTQGARVELIKMTDPYSALTAGARGTVNFVDDTGTVFVNWDSGSSLGAVYGEDEIRLLSDSEIIKEQCRQVAKTGKTNMFDTEAAFDIAIEMGLTNLAHFIAFFQKAYIKLILTGELSDSDLKNGSKKNDG